MACSNVPGWDPLILVLVGPTGVGKSATGNTILGRYEFESMLSYESATRYTAWGKGTVAGQRDVVVIDTPGLFDTRDDMTPQMVATEISKCIGIAMSQGSGIDAIILTLSADQRLTEEHVKTIEFLRKLFGEEMMKYVVLLFTKKDQLEANSTTLGALLSRGIPPFLTRLLDECNGRVVAFNNKSKDRNVNEQQTAELIQVIEDLKSQNGNKPFRNDITERAKACIESDREKNYSETGGRDKQCEDIASGINFEVIQQIGAFILAFLPLVIEIIKAIAELPE